MRRMQEVEILSTPTSDKFVVPYPNEFVHSSPDHVLCDDDWAGHAKDLAETRLAVFICNLWKGALCVWECTCHAVSVLCDEGESWRTFGAASRRVRAQRLGGSLRLPKRATAGVYQDALLSDASLDLDSLFIHPTTSSTYPSYASEVVSAYAKLPLK